MLKESALWSRVSEKEKEEIKQEARKIMDSFSEALESVKEEVGEAFVDRENDRRAEKEGGEKCDEEFREIMFDNAPKKNKDFIIAEKGEWT